MVDRSNSSSNSALGYCVYNFDPLGFENYMNNASKKVEVQDPIGRGGRWLRQCKAANIH